MHFVERKENPVLSLLHEFLFGPSVPLPKIVANLLSNLKSFFQRIFSPLFKGSPFGRRISGRLDTIEQFSPTLNRKVRIEIYLPPWYDEYAARHHYFPTLLLNDGQDLGRMNLPHVLTELYRHSRIQQMICVGIFPDRYRMEEYGTASTPDYKNRGARADVYTDFILTELLPWLRSNYRVSIQREKMAIAGFSLGGLSAFDIAYHNPRHFGWVGVFSGALWWRSQPFKEEDPDADRIVHHYVRSSRMRIGQGYWFQTGTLDETSDRNNNGVIDAIDDTLDLIKALKDQGVPEHVIRYIEIEGGRHEPNTWGKAMYDFLDWVF